MSQKKLLIVNGPGLTDLSNCDGKTSGNLSLQGIHDECAALCEKLAIELDFRQTNDEDEMLRWIATSSEDCDALIVNPTGCSTTTSHESNVLNDAISNLASLNKPVIEVHITNIFQDGPESAKPLHVPEGKLGFICGMGLHSYLLAIKALDRKLNDI